MYDTQVAKLLNYIWGATNGLHKYLKQPEAKYISRQSEDINLQNGLEPFETII